MWRKSSFTTFSVIEIGEFVYLARIDGVEGGNLRMIMRFLIWTGFMVRNLFWVGTLDVSINIKMENNLVFFPSSSVFSSFSLSFSLPSFAYLSVFLFAFYFPLDFQIRI